MQCVGGADVCSLDPNVQTQVLFQNYNFYICIRGLVLLFFVVVVCTRIGFYPRIAVRWRCRRVLIRSPITSRLRCDFKIGNFFGTVKTSLTEQIIAKGYFVYQKH